MSKPLSNYKRKAFASLGDDVTLTRFVKTGAPVERPRKDQQKRPGGDRSHYPNAVEAPSTTMLKTGHNSVKIGRDVRKGVLFRGYWIYSLSFEERVTCPRSCHHWDTCYGNNMPFAKRVDPTDPGFEEALRENVRRLLGVRGRVGVLIRLHGLGDFYSAEYVSLWDDLLSEHENLACFGYTAHIEEKPQTSIGAAISRTKREHGRRFAIRWSGERVKADAAVPFVSRVPAGVIACPEQTGATRCCATCALCWETDKPIGFAEH